MKVLITGGIGCGKSTLINALKEKGIPVFEIDAISKDSLLEPIVIAHYELVFGDGCFESPGKLKKPCIDEFFANKEKREVIQTFMRKHVGSKLNTWYENNSMSDFVAIECASPKSLGIVENFDIIMSCIVSREERIRRVKLRDGRTDEQIQAIIEMQDSEVDIIKYSDVTYTDGFPDAEIVIKDIKRVINKRLTGAIYTLERTVTAEKFVINECKKRLLKLRMQQVSPRSASYEYVSYKIIDKETICCYYEVKYLLKDKDSFFNTDKKQFTFNINE